MEYAQSTIIVTGLARPSKDDPIAILYQVFFLTLIVDKDTDVIVNATCNTARVMTEDFIRSLLVGKNLSKGMDNMVQEIRQRYFGMAQKTLIVALKDAHNRYLLVTKT
jgi:hypothetical protein